MPTRFLEFYKFYYIQDNGDSVVKVQEIYYRTEDGQPVIPITATFINQTVFDPDIIPIQGTAGMRHALVCSLNPYNQQGFSEGKSYLPYPPGNPLLAQHLREIYATSWVKSVEYNGESRKIE